MDWTTSYENTNYNFLIDEKVALLAPYTAKQPGIYWCPTDKYLSTYQRKQGWDHRVRSVAMDGAVGEGKKYNFGWPMFVAVKMSDLRFPGPSTSWVFIDEHPDSIDDCILYCNPAESNGTGSFTELPAGDHYGGCGVVF